jgi:hypothetical protein
MKKIKLKAQHSYKKGEYRRDKKFAKTIDQSRETYKFWHTKFTSRTFKSQSAEFNDLIEDVCTLSIDKKCENENCQKLISKKNVLQAISKFTVHSLDVPKCYFCGEMINFTISVRIGTDKGLHNIQTFIDDEINLCNEYQTKYYVEELY